MPAVVSMDTQWGAVVEGSASRRRSGSAAMDGKNRERGPLAGVRFRNGYDLPTHPQRGGGAGPRWVGAAISSLVVRVLRRVERQGGFRGT